MSASAAKRARVAGRDASVTTRDLSSLGDAIKCMAVDRDGTWFVCTNSALYVITPTGMRRRRSLLLGTRQGRASRTAREERQDSVYQWASP